MIRKAEEKDLSEIVDIYNSAIPSRMATADIKPVSLAERLIWFKFHSDTRPIIIYEKDGKVAGWISFKDFYGRPAYHLTAEIAVYVATEYQGQGVGSQLLANAVEMAPELGLKNILAFVFSHNLPSIKLFEKFGFSNWGQLPEVAAMDGSLYSLSILGLKV